MFPVKMKPLVGFKFHSFREKLVSATFFRAHFSKVMRAFSPGDVSVVASVVTLAGSKGKGSCLPTQRKRENGS